MAIEWLKRLTESKEDQEKRVMDEFAKTDDFKELVKGAAVDMLREAREEEERQKKQKEEEEAKKLEESKMHVERIADSMSDSPEPFCNVLASGFDPSMGIRVKLDYNDAFIRYLNKAGIQAANDDETVRLWLAHLNYDIEQEMLAADYLRNGVGEDELPSMSYDEYFPEDEEEDDNDKSDPRW